MEDRKTEQPGAAPDVPGSVDRHYIKGVGGVVLLMVGFFLGTFVSDLRAEQRMPEAGANVGEVVNRDGKVLADLPENVDFEAYWDVWEMIKRRHVDRGINDVDLFYGSLEGMVGSLDDPYSVFFDPAFAKKFAEELSGTFEGIGAEIGIKQDQLTVIAPLNGTPAFNAGLKSGDKIIAIDEVDTFGMTIDEAVSRIRGPGGTQVTLRIWRDGMDETMDIVITRDTIVIESVEWRIEERDGGRYGVIEISHFNETSGPKFTAAVQELLIEDLDGVVLDLRNNPGGFLETAVDIAGEWIAQDLIVAEKFSDGSTRNYTSDGTARFGDVKTVVLVNGGSASASEIVAGALQDHAKAAVIGERTYGKGSVQDYVEFDDGSALKLTIALWLTPHGRSIEKEGITPNETVEFTIEDFENDRDPQLDRAFEVLGGSPLRPAPAAEQEDGV